MDSSQWTGDEPDPYVGLVRCETCGQDCGSHPIELPFGVFCTQECADEGERQFTDRMKRAGFMTVEPEPDQECPF